MKLNSLSFLAVDVSSTAFNRPDDWIAPHGAALRLTCEEVRLLENEIEALIRDRNCGEFVREPAEKLRGVVRHFWSEAGECEPVAPICNAPWVSAVVEADGTVKPCFFHAPIGSLGGSNTLLDVLNSPGAIEFRRGLDVAQNAMCRRCVCSLNYRAAHLEG